MNQLVEIDTNSHPLYELKDAREIILLIIEVIHGIPFLFHEKERVDLYNLQVYIGKTSEGQILNRAKSHLRSKDTPYFIPISWVNHSLLSLVEKMGLKYLHYLELKNFLCFGELLNEKNGSPGRVTESKGLIYLSFRIDKRHSPRDLMPKKELQWATGYFINDFQISMGEKREEDEITDILTSLSRIEQKTKLYWKS